MNREEMIRALTETKMWDLIIIGGGATGLWCAVDAASRGYKTVLLEKGDFAEGTSSRSTKLFHGGLRYLKQGRLGLVHEGLIERGYLAQNAPHLFTTRPFLLPFYNNLDKPYYKMGMLLYDFLAGKLVLQKHKLLSRNECLAACPTLRSDGLKGGALYCDGQFDDARFAIELAKTSADHGATLLNYCKVESLLKTNGKLSGVIATDLETEKQFELQGQTIINATGIFADKLCKIDNPKTPSLMALSRGSHIIVDKKFLPKETALIVPKTGDKRVIFVIPWQNTALIGTTEAIVDKPSNNPIPSKEEIDFLLDHAKMILNPFPLKEDILGAFAGIRPLVKSNHTKSSAKLSRNHEIIKSASGLITIAGGKWTTGRKMAEDTINKAFKERRPCKTKHLALHQTTLPSTFEDEIKEAIQNEMALFASDVLARRSRLLLTDTKKALTLAPATIHQIARLRGKSSDWEALELAKLHDYAKSFLT